MVFSGMKFTFTFSYSWHSFRHRLTYKSVQYSTVQYSTVQYSTVQYSTVQYSTVRYSTVLIEITHTNSQSQTLYRYMYVQLVEHSLLCDLREQFDRNSSLWRWFHVKYMYTDMSC